MNAKCYLCLSLTNSAFYLFAKYSKSEYFLNDNVDLWNCIYFQGINNIYMSYFYAGTLTNYSHNNRKDNYPFCNLAKYFWHYIKHQLYNGHGVSAIAGMLT